MPNNFFLDSVSFSKVFGYCEKMVCLCFRKLSPQPIQQLRCLRCVLRLTVQLLVELKRDLNIRLRRLICQKEAHSLPYVLLLASGASQTH